MFGLLVKISPQLLSNYFYRTQVYLGSDLWVPTSVSNSLTHSLRNVFADLTDVTLAGKDTNSILTDSKAM